MGVQLGGTMFHFIEIEIFSNMNEWDAESTQILIAFLGTLVFAVWGASALRAQIHKIKDEGSESVSVLWKLVFLAGYFALLPYGLQENKLALVVQFFCRVPFYILIVRLTHKDRERFTYGQYAVGTAMIGAMAASLFYGKLVATGLLFLGILTTLDQPYRIWKSKKTEGVENKVLVVYFLSSLFWLFYGKAIGDMFIIAWAGGYSLVYLASLTAYQIYKPKHP